MKIRNPKVNQYSFLDNLVGEGQLHVTSKCCCDHDLLRAPVPGCWPRRAGGLGSTPLDQACLVAPVASQIMAPPLRAPACAPAKCAI